MPKDPKRQHQRRAVRVEFRIRDADDAFGGEIVFDTVDISEGGAFLRADYLLEDGERLEVSFTLPQSTAAIVVRAKVAWVTKRATLKGDAGMGLQFVDLSDAERDAILSFVRGGREE